eukprot:TRINITY_DN21470_c0_g1_i1.p1 TRINITY_DN21470_c0_g1~~TRINITY_DN21470_c0_g1_i1.p1  ORF type:complete len:606 (-),score=193.72 TRINITY_DN21470_c0_g1_i1:249-2066(-)
MPTISLERDELFKRLGDSYGTKPNQPSEEADKRFDHECFQFGVELDDVTSERAMELKEKGETAVKDVSNLSDKIIYKIDVPANRYDILCMEGFSRALRIFQGKEDVPVYTVLPPTQKMIVAKEVEGIRKFVVCAVLRNIHFDQAAYDSFIDLQEKLHQNICRRRTLVSIGTHDLDTIQGPFSYEALPPKEIVFTPLRGSNKDVDGEQLMQLLDKDLQLRKYLPIIRDSPRYPVIYDAKRRVLSLPPIINGDHSKITLKTTNVLIEVTATDLTKAQTTLNIMVTMFAEYCQQKFSVESVEVQYPDGSKMITPDLSMRTVKTSVKWINSSIGAEIEGNVMAKSLSRMCLPAKLTSDGDSLEVQVPCTRSDVLHPCDVMEDVAIAYGFENLKIEPPKTVTEGKQFLLNKISDALRSESAAAGFSEVLSLALCSEEETFGDLNRPNNNSAVKLANPKTIEFQVARTSLLVGLLKSVAANHGKSGLPIQMFEVSDIVLKDQSKDVGARNQRNMSAVYCNHTPGFEIIHGLLDRVMLLNSVTWREEGKKVNGAYYYLKASSDPAFLEGRRADVFLNDVKVGVLGVIHPDVLTKYHIPFPCSALEICVEPFV